MRKVLLVAPPRVKELAKPPGIELEIIRGENNKTMIVVSEIGIYAVSTETELARLLRDISKTAKS